MVSSAEELRAVRRRTARSCRTRHDPCRPCCSPTSSGRPRSRRRSATTGGRDCVERHHAVVRDALGRWRGVENDTAGDGFYATFDGPARAIRCAQEVGARVRDLGIEIRAGVHTGECELIDGKVGGIAVSIGARVASLAGPSRGLDLPDREGPRGRERSQLRRRRRARAEGRPRPLAPLPGGELMTSIPSVQYAKNGDFTLAYQVVGTGPKDLIYLPAGNAERGRATGSFPSTLDSWSDSRRSRGSSSRIVAGWVVPTDLPPGRAPTLEELVDDLLVVMETAYASPATVLAGDETAFIAMLAAATHPDLFEGLILWGATPSWRRSDELPWEASDDAIEASLGTIRRVTNLRAWAEAHTRDVLPSWAADPEKIALIEGAVGTGRSGGGLVPGPAHVLRHRPQRSPPFDPRADPAPRTRRSKPVRRSRARASSPNGCPTPRLVELEGRDSFPWVGDADAVLDEIEEFMTGTRESAGREPCTRDGVVHRHR